MITNYFATCFRVGSNENYTQRMMNEELMLRFKKTKDVLLLMPVFMGYWGILFARILGRFTGFKLDDTGDALLHFVGVEKHHNLVLLPSIVKP